MRTEGWTLLFPSLSKQIAPFPRNQHRLVGSRCRRFFQGYGKSDGTIVGHLIAKKNEGLALLHCLHDDGDEEDLGEEEAATAVSDFSTDCKTKVWVRVRVRVVRVRVIRVNSLPNLTLTLTLTLS
jgi:hypothetical protein